MRAPNSNSRTEVYTLYTVLDDLALGRGGRLLNSFHLSIPPAEYRRAQSVTFLFRLDYFSSKTYPNSSTL